MKFSTYLLLIGGASASSDCTSQEKVDASTEKSTKIQAYADAIVLKTADVIAFEEGLKPLQTHLSEMNQAYVLANTGTVVADDLAAAYTNLQAAQTAVDSYLAEPNHAGYNKILVDIAQADINQQIAIEDYIKSFNACIPDSVAAYAAETLETIKTDLGYADLTADEQAEFDEKMAKRSEKKNEDMAEMKGHAGYHEMSLGEQNMYDTMLIAQSKLKAEQASELKENMTQMKTKEDFENMTDEQKKAFREKMMKKGDDFMDRHDKWDKDDNDMRVQGGYWDKMDSKEKGKFDDKLGEMQKGRQDRMKDWGDKFDKRGDGSDSDCDSDDFRGEMKKDMDRRDKYDKEDMFSKSNSGYFMKMNDKERGNYDEMDGKFKKGRDDNDKDWDDKWSKMKKGGDFCKKDGQGKKDFRKDFDNERDWDDQQKWLDRQFDDDYRNTKNYWRQDMKGREDMDKKIGKMQGQRDEVRMGTGTGGIGASCNPMAHHMMKQKMGGKGGKGGRGDSDGEGPDGPPRGGKRRLEEVEEKEEWEGQMDMFKKMKEKHGAMENEDQMNTMREKMGQMKEKWDKTGKIEGGMGDFKDMFKKMGGKSKPGMGDMMDGGGCQVGLCCGQTLQGGVWTEEHICNTETSLNYEQFRFMCAQGAKNLAASAVALLVSAYYMA